MLTAYFMVVAIRVATVTPIGPLMAAFQSMSVCHVALAQPHRRARMPRLHFPTTGYQRF